MEHSRLLRPSGRSPQRCHALLQPIRVRQVVHVTQQLVLLPEADAHVRRRSRTRIEVNRSEAFQTGFRVQNKSTCPEKKKSYCLGCLSL